MGCLIKIIFALTILMIVYGAAELTIWLRERSPVEMTVRQYAAADKPPKWVVLKDGWVDFSEATEASGDWYVPVRPVGSTGQTNIVMEIRDSAHLKLARELSAKRAAAGQTTTTSSGDGSVYTGPISGLGGGELLAGRRRERKIRSGGAVASRFVILRQNATPSLWLPLLSLVGGCVLVRAGFWVAWAGRRPKPPKEYHGPPLPPEQMIAETRRIARDAPRKIKRYGGLLVGKPLWLLRDETDALNMIYLEEQGLLTNGRIVWGQIVQANRALFEPGDGDAPAAILYSTDPHFDAHPEDLADIADMLFLLKGEETQPDLTRFASVLADELTREMRLEVPRRLTEGREVIYTSIVVRRADLPDGRLAEELFPLLVLPQQTPATLIAPWEWWSPAVVARWRQKVARSPPPLPVPPPTPHPPMAPPPLPPR